MSLHRAPEEPGQQSPVPEDRYRDKTVTSACERCRRRKIRCDNETPCKTCRRFRLNCVRVQRNDTTSLEHRVRQLEEHITNITASSVDGGQFQPPSLEIPSIHVDYADTLSPISPVSPSSVAWPSHHSLENPGALHSSSTSSIFPDSSPMPYLSPRSLPAHSRSRSSSLSSLGFEDWSSAPGDLSTYNTLYEPSISNDSTTSFVEAWPTRADCKAVLERFSENVQAARYPRASYPLDRNQLLGFLDMVDGRAPLRDGISISMARFHVYMAMAVGLRVEPDQDYLVQKCYHLAMDQTRAATFWREAFGIEAAMLLMMFAQVSEHSNP